MALVRDGTFRADLFYRLAVLPIHLPPLRERKDDIPRLWDHILSRVVPVAHSPLDPASPIGQTLLAHDWPGNVRELRNAAEFAARAAGSGPIHPEHLPPTVRSAVAEMPQRDDLADAVAHWARTRLTSVDDDLESCLYEELIELIERPLLREVGVWSGGNQVRMARRLGLHRSTLRQKLRRHGLDPAGDDASNP